MSFKIEGWIPTLLEKSIMDGSFDAASVDTETPTIDDDLLDVKEFNIAMQELKAEIATW